LLLAQLFEVTVISTMDGTPTVVPVIVKLVIAVVAVLDSVKYAVADDSGLAFTSIVTPEAGRLAETLTVSGKVVPAEGGSVVLIAGVVVTVSAVSLQPPPLPPPPFLHAGSAANTNKRRTTGYRVFFMSVQLAWERMVRV
jgi:hypothetical protein